jgi:hypothetical protein
MPIRLHKLDNAPPACIHMLLRHAVRESRKRGYEMYLLWVGNDTKEQRELREMCMVRGATAVPMNGMWFADA